MSDHVPKKALLAKIWRMRYRFVAGFAIFYVGSFLLGRMLGVIVLGQWDRYYLSPPGERIAITNYEITDGFYFPLTRLETYFIREEWISDTFLPGTKEWERIEFFTEDTPEEARRDAERVIGIEIPNGRSFAGDHSTQSQSDFSRTETTFVLDSDEWPTLLKAIEEKYDDLSDEDSEYHRTDKNGVIEIRTGEYSAGYGFTFTPPNLVRIYASHSD